MLIVSWNVAGLKPALQKIYADYGSNHGGNRSGSPGVGGGGGEAEPKSKPAAASFHPFAHYLRRHGDVDVLCLQEHKIPLALLKDRAEPRSCAAVPGYESFWSCATRRRCRGFNGVVTYVRTGLVKAADGAPLRDPELDEQGRCVMTDHGAFVIFNVYVPNASGVDPDGNSKLPNKMKFLRALHAAMMRQRVERGKHVILVGDMNLTIGRRDVYWMNRRLHVDGILEQTRQSKENGNRSNDVKVHEEPPEWKVDISKHWEEIATVLKTIEAVPCQTTNPSTKETFDRFRARVQPGENNYLWLGNYEDCAEDALGPYDLGERSEILYSDAAAVVVCKANVLSVKRLVEVMSKICRVTWSASTQRQVADADEAGLNPDSPAYLWMKSLLDDKGMVDVFRHFYPTAEARFTCWHQFKKGRYTNLGARIDFTLVDRALFDQVEPPGDRQALRCGKRPHENPLGEEAALVAATAGGLFEGGSFEGGGIAVATQRALDTQFGAAHNGMIYTPPAYSDHIAVSLLMKRDFKAAAVGTLTLGGDPATRKAQPHKAQRSIASFFGARAATAGASAAPSGGTKRALSSQASQSSKKAAKGHGSATSLFSKAAPSSGGRKASSREARASDGAAKKNGGKKNGAARGARSAATSSTNKKWYFGKK